MAKFPVNVKIEFIGKAYAFFRSSKDKKEILRRFKSIENRHSEGLRLNGSPPSKFEMILVDGISNFRAPDHNLSTIARAMGNRGANYVIEGSFPDRIRDCPVYKQDCHCYCADELEWRLHGVVLSEKLPLIEVFIPSSSHNKYMRRAPYDDKGFELAT